MPAVPYLSCHYQYLHFNEQSYVVFNLQYILSTNTSKWIVEYPRDLYEAGEYTVHVKLMKNFYGIWYLYTTSSTTFELTGTINLDFVSLILHLVSLMCFKYKQTVRYIKLLVINLVLRVNSHLYLTQQTSYYYIFCL